jgi:hypothetical protein
MDLIDQVGQGNEGAPSSSAHRLNMAVALAVAVVATFMGITEVKSERVPCPFVRELHPTALTRLLS